MSFIELKSIKIDENLLQNGGELMARYDSLIATIFGGKICRHSPISAVRWRA